MLATRIEQWEIDILEKGIEKGEVALFLKMLELKYGTLPDWAREKVAHANGETIENWAAKMFDAKTLAEVFE